MTEETTIHQSIVCDACQADFELSWTDTGEPWSNLVCPFCGNKTNMSRDSASRSY